MLLLRVWLDSILTLQVSCGRAMGQTAERQMHPEALSMVFSFVVFVVSR